MGLDMDNQRQSSNTVRFGTVVSVDAASATCRVSSGDITTTDIPWLAQAAGACIAWSAPRVGEQVLLLCPEGDIEGGVVIRGLYSNQFPPPRDRIDTTLIRFGDGAELEYDEAAHKLAAILPAAGTAELTAEGGVTINGPLTVNGNTTINGDTVIDGDANVSKTVTADTDVIAAGISTKGHKHRDVQSGSSLSGGPV